MLDSHTQPLHVAARVLRLETLRAVSRSPFNCQGWAIIDRWAFNTPRALLALESQGAEALQARLLAQQTLELAALQAEDDILGRAASDNERLTLAGVDTELRS